MFAQKHLEAVWNATCAIGFVGTVADRPAETWFATVGTGLLVRENLILTTRQIASWFDDNGKSDQILLNFTYRLPKTKFQQRAVPVTASMAAGDPKLEVALMRFERPPVGGGFDVCQPAAIIQSIGDLQLGEDIGMLAYPSKATMLVDSGANLQDQGRIGPVLVRGSIGGFYPWQGPTAYRLCVDFGGCGGSSGSPVFRMATGEVIGVFTGPANEPTLEGTANLPTVQIGEAVALDPAIVAKLIEDIEGHNTEFRRF